METQQQLDIINHLLNHDIFQFKSLKQFESPPTTTEIKSKLSTLLSQDLGLFLQRYMQYLTPHMLDYFTPFKSNYEVEFYLNNSKLDDSKLFRNRRFNYIQNHLEYFSDENIQENFPLLYQEYIGQYFTQEEHASTKQMSDVEKLFAQLDQNQMYINKMEYINTLGQEYDDESSDSETVKDFETTKDVIKDTNELKIELHRILKERFIAGLDESFDYSKVDENYLYDDLKEQNQSSCDAYFEND